MPYKGVTDIVCIIKKKPDAQLSCYTFSLYLISGFAAHTVSLVYFSVLVSTSRYKNMFSGTYKLGFG